MKIVVDTVYMLDAEKLDALKQLEAMQVQLDRAHGVYQAMLNGGGLYGQMFDPDHPNFVQKLNTDVGRDVFGLPLSEPGLNTMLNSYSKHPSEAKSAKIRVCFQYMNPEFVFDEEAAK